jgi:coenzyme PQQ precursor peptide PqqA
MAGVRGGRRGPRASEVDERDEGFRFAMRTANFKLMTNREETIMAWTTPTLVEICVGLEINGYLPAEF